MASDLTVDRTRDLPDSKEHAGDPPDWFDRVFSGDDVPPRLPEEPDRWRWQPSGRALSSVYFLLGLCCGLLAAYVIYHAGGQW
jgi:hypothetical protein